MQPSFVYEPKPGSLSCRHFVLYGAGSRMYFKEFKKNNKKFVKVWVIRIVPKEHLLDFDWFRCYSVITYFRS